MAQVRVQAFVIFSLVISLSNGRSFSCYSNRIEFEGQNTTEPFMGPVCCNSGYLTSSYPCPNQGKMCAKAEGEKCGGVISEGPCASGLFCKIPPCPPKSIVGVGCTEGDNPGICKKKSSKTSKKKGNEDNEDNEKEWPMIKTTKCTSPMEGLQCRCDGGRESCVKPSKADLENPKLKGKIGKEGWCWIGNLQHPYKTRSFCYEDVRYNVPHGRYYSYDACDPQKKPLDKEYVDEEEEEWEHDHSDLTEYPGTHEQTDESQSFSDSISAEEDSTGDESKPTDDEGPAPALE